MSISVSLAPVNTEVSVSSANDITVSLTNPTTTVTVTNAALQQATSVIVSDSTSNTSFPVVFHDESNALLDDTGGLTYNPSNGVLTASFFNGTFAGTVTQASQPQITSLGTLTGLNVSGTVTATTFSGNATTATTASNVMSTSINSTGQNIQTSTNNTRFIHTGGAVNFAVADETYDASAIERWIVVNAGTADITFTRTNATFTKLEVGDVTTSATTCKLKEGGVCEIVLTANNTFTIFGSGVE